MKFIDTHAHIYYDDYKNNIDDVIQRANEKREVQILPSPSLRFARFDDLRLPWNQQYSFSQ